MIWLPCIGEVTRVKSSGPCGMLHMFGVLWLGVIFIVGSACWGQSSLWLVDITMHGGRSPNGPPHWVCVHILWGVGGRARLMDNTCTGFLVGSYHLTWCVYK